LLRFILVLIFAISLLGISSSKAQQLSKDNSKPLRIAVAANFTPILKILLKDFSKNTGIKTQVISGASGAMFLQIKHGAPYDVFLSADSRRPKELEQADYILKNSRKTYARGQLALYSSSHSMQASEPLSLDLLSSPPARFAIANPDIAPYGKAAKEVLTHLALWRTYQDRLIKGINIGQTFAQIRSKSVTLGIVSNSQLILNNLPGLIIPNNYHQPIEQQLVIIGASKNKAAAKKLSQFLLSTKSQATIVSYGYAQTNKSKG